MGLLGSWALSPARPTPIHPRHECRGFPALLVTEKRPTGRPRKHPTDTARQQANRARHKRLAQLAADVLFPYFGAKAAIAPVVWQRFGAVKHYVEPFAGSAAVYLGCPQRLKHATLNDQDGYIVNTLRSLRDAPKDVARVANWPASEIDLDAKSRRLYASLTELEARLRADDRYCDTELAGLWVWVMSARMPTRLVKGLGHGKEYLQVTTAHGLFAGEKRARLPAICTIIGAKLSAARILCRGWRKMLTETILLAHGTPVGVFLDPPYTRQLRDAHLYAHDGDMAGAVRDWAVQQGEDRRLRIALCGLEGEHAMPAGWTPYPWTTRGGMRNTAAHGRGRGETRKETVWFSPHCLRPAQLNLLQEDTP